MSEKAETEPVAAEPDPSGGTPSETEIATFGGGCFWCVEAVFERIDGVLSATSGYQGGASASPTYEEVCSGRSGHAEVVRIEFDPSKVKYCELLDLFWQAHDPTTRNQQGADVGTQYRSTILVHNDEQMREAEASKKALDESGTFDDPVVTEIVEAGAFYPAEDYHQDYYRQNRRAPYCQFVIQPKLEKLGME
jgi:peptide-methionine (S)-S-oxide reductase